MRVSIVVCNFNYGQYVDHAIRSAVDQMHDDVEVIVVDDGSTDESRTVIDRWQDRVRSVYKANGGQVSAYNAGYECATGEIVMFLDADDALRPEACGSIVEAFASPDVVKVHFRLELMGADGALLGTMVPRSLDRGDLSQQLRKGCLYQSAPGSGNAYRRSALQRLMPLLTDAADRHGADFFTIYGISLLGKVAAVDEPLATYRIQSQHARTGLSFGNAVRTSPEPERALGRYRRLHRLVRERLGSEYGIAPDFADFSVDKLGFAGAVFDAPTYLKGLSAGLSYLHRRLYRAIRARPGSTASRVGLLGWSFAVLVLPRRVGMPVARYVCNPASR